MALPDRNTPRVWYRSTGWKYTLTRGYSHPGQIPGFEKVTGDIRDIWDNLLVRIVNGRLTVYPGYSYDGASGPTIDDDTNMRAALVHDTLYQLTREVVQPKTDKEWRKYQKAADVAFREILKEDGMPFWRRWYYYRALRWFGLPYIQGKREGRGELHAPPYREGEQP